MRLLRNLLSGAIAIAATVALIQPAAATQFNWLQSAGFFFPGASAAGTLRAGQTPLFSSDTAIAGNGGLEFYADAVLPAAPAGTYHLISWGCPLDGDTDNPPVSDNSAACSNAGVFDNAVTLTDPTPDPGEDGRSLLRLRTFDDTTGGGVLDSLTGNIVFISQLELLNRRIDNEANALKAITINSLLTITGATFTSSGTDTEASSVALTFLETDNLSACPPPNPLGSSCDDIFTFAGDFSNVEFTSGGTPYFLQFGLAPIPDCDDFVGNFPGSPTIQIFQCSDHQIAIDFVNGIAWAPEGFDSGIRVSMFVTEQPVGRDGCTPGYWKQPQHFGSYTLPFFPGQTLAAAFGGPAPNDFGGSPDFPKIKNKPDINEATMTLVQALGQGGGDTNALLRHFVAAVLNAASPDVVSQYENIQQIVDAVKAVLAGGDATLGGVVYDSVESLKNALEAANSAGCPLGRNE